jgi:hypothetical protein
MRPSLGRYIRICATWFTRMSRICRQVTRAGADAEARKLRAKSVSCVSAIPALLNSSFGECLQLLDALEEAGDIKVEAHDEPSGAKTLVCGPRNLKVFTFSPLLALSIKSQVDSIIDQKSWSKYVVCPTTGSALSAGGHAMQGLRRLSAPRLFSPSFRRGR